MAGRIGILGAGESGVGAALLAKQKGYDVFVSDFGNIKPKYKQELTKAEIEFEEGKHSEEELLKSEVVIVSPGISKKIGIIQKIVNIEIPIISEIEFAYQFITNEYIIAITGSNGKTTTTTLLYSILEEAGLNVAIGGNIGKSFARTMYENSYEYYVLELSSFQLDDCITFKPNISILLNITPDHLDRYNYDFDLYKKSKFSILKNQTEEDHFIYCSEDVETTNAINKYLNNVQTYSFAIEKTPNTSAYTTQNQLIINHKENEFIMSIYELGLQGKHNYYNTMAAGIAANILDLSKDSIKQSLANFTSLEHRLEKVLTISGVDFINDSKATNVNSTWYALETIPGPIVWIAGGVDKGNEYEVLKSMVKNKVKVIVCLGTEISKLHRSFSSMVDLIVNTQSMEEAVQLAYHFSEKKDKVLLSPACASFDLFDNYEDRGNQFKECVRQL